MPPLARLRVSKVSILIVHTHPSFAFPQTSHTAMPPRLTLRELQARRRRAKEGCERFEAANDRIKMELNRRVRETNVDEALRIRPFSA